MSSEKFVDYYEMLQISPNADTETIERIFRHFAKKHHPDNNESADHEHFYQLVEAHKVLSDPESRASYDIKHQNYWNNKWSIAAMASDSSALTEDKTVRERLLSMLYFQRRRYMNKPGLGEHEMARLINTPHELVEFHLWYFRSKGWIERLENGHLAITAEGVDEAEQHRHLLDPSRLIENQSSHQGDEGNSNGENSV